MNGLLDLIEKLSERTGVQFLITEAVKREIVDTPEGIHRFELGALRIESMIEKGIIKMPSDLGLNSAEIKIETQKMLNEINCAFEASGQCIKIVSEAEISCLAASKLLEKKGHKTMVAVDERTTRVLFEKPQNLVDLLASKLHQRIQMKNTNFKKAGQFSFIRSSELVYVAYKKGLIDLKGKKVLEALLYATKYKGAAISEEEIEQLKKL